MRHRTWNPLLLIALAGLLWLVPGSVTAAPPDSAAAGWIFDVRIIRVELENGALAEQRPAFQASGSSTTDLRPEAILQALAARGPTRLVLDQRVTTTDGTSCHVNQESQENQMLVVQKDLHNETQRASPIMTGSSVVLLPSGDSLSYEIRLNYVGARPSASATPPRIQTSQWKGTHGGAAARTLVLHLAEQDPSGSATEIYVAIRAQRGS